MVSPSPNINLLWLAGIAGLLGLAGCSGLSFETAEGQCEAAKKALIVAQSEFPDDADMLRRAQLAVVLACPATE